MEGFLETLEKFELTWSADWLHDSRTEQTELALICGRLAHHRPDYWLNAAHLVTYIIYKFTIHLKLLKFFPSTKKILVGWKLSYASESEVLDQHLTLRLPFWHIHKSLWWSIRKESWTKLYQNNRESLKNKNTRLYNHVSVKKLLTKTTY